MSSAAVLRLSPFIQLCIGIQVDLDKCEDAS